MENNEKDKAVLAAIIKRFDEQRLPRLLEIKKNVNQGLTLSNHEINFLEEVFKDARENESYLKKADNDLKELVGKVMGLYQEITKKALENEQKSS